MIYYLKRNGINRRILVILLFVLLFGFSNVFSQQDSIKENVIAKEGWSFGVLPIYKYDSDFGSSISCSFKMYDYGDGTIYPDYKHLLYYSFSRSILGPTAAMMRYDSKTLIEGFRINGSIGYYTLPASTFYGFNGYESHVESAFTDIKDPLYKSSMYYRFHKTLTRIKLNLIKNVEGSGLKFVIGSAFQGVTCKSVDIDKYNSRVEGNNKLQPISVQPGLYEDMINWGIIKDDEKDGGNNLQLKLGLAYDTRDFEPNPMKGVFSEAIIVGNKSFNSSRTNFLAIGATHRQYFTIIKDRMNFLYRLGIQNKIAGDIPFYMLPYIYQSYKPSIIGLGGKSTMRGVSFLRIIGDGYFYGGAETRYKLYKTTLYNQNVYLGLSAFTDFGMVTQKYKIDSDQQEAIDYLSAGGDEQLHVSYGGAGHIVFNENFIISITYGRSVDPRDGDYGYYIGLDYNY